MFKRTLIILALITLPVSAFAAPRGAEKSLGTFGGWQAFSSTQGNTPLCYMTLTKTFGKPAKGQPKRGNAYLMITHRPGEGSTDVVSYTAGYNFKAVEEATMRIGKDDFSLFTQKDTAWARDAHTDHAIASAINANKSMTMTGIPGTKGAKPTIDTIDLTGADKAYAAIGKACGIIKDVPKPAAKTPAKAPTKVTKPAAKTTAKTPVKMPAKATTPNNLTKKTTHK